MVKDTNERLEPSEDDSTSVQKINVNPLEVHDKLNSKSLNSDFVGKHYLIIFNFDNFNNKS